MRATFKHFVGSPESWETLFTEAANFASEVGPDRLIGISHSHSGGTEPWVLNSSGVVTVWYWEQAERPSVNA
jgi:hypothetical protein